VNVQHSESHATRPKLDVERIQLPNGLVVLLSEDHATPSVSINAIVRAGSRFESDEKAGLASLTGELLDGGTTNRTSEEIAEMIEAVGGQLNTFGDYQLSGASLALLSKDLDLGLDVTSDVLMNATFPEYKVREAVDRRVAQIKARLDVPRTQASDVFNELVFAGTPQHRPPIGYESTVATLTRSDVDHFYRRFYSPDNTILALVGDIDKDVVQDKLEATFGRWERAAQVTTAAVPRPQRQTFPIERFVAAPKEQANIIVGHVGVERNNRDYYALVVMDTILGSSPGFTSRIPRILRDELGLAYTTFSNITSSAGLDPGRFIAYIGTAPENVSRAIAGLKTEIVRIVEEGVTLEELEVAKSYLTGSYVFRFQKNTQVAEFLIECEIYNLGFDFAERYPELIRAVTVEEVTRVSRKYIDPRNLTTVVVGPFDERKEEGVS